MSTAKPEPSNMTPGEVWDEIHSRSRSWWRTTQTRASRLESLQRMTRIYSALKRVAMRCGVCPVCGAEIEREAR